MVPGMTEPPPLYNVTVTVDRDGDHLPNPAEYAVAAERAASARAASITSAYTASQIVGIVTVLAADQSAAVAVALAVVSDALNHRVVSSTH
jgi:hypothetical protein